VGYQAGEERERVTINGKPPSPILAWRVPLGDKVIGMVKGHQDHDQAAQRVEWEQAGGLVASSLGSLGFVFFRHDLALSKS
jgi:hypothetical protein